MKFLLELPIFRGGNCEVLVSGMAFHRCSWFSGICTRCPNSLHVSQICLFDFKNPNTKKKVFTIWNRLISESAYVATTKHTKHLRSHLMLLIAASCVWVSNYFLLKKDRKTLEELEMILFFEITFWRKANESQKPLLQWGWCPLTMPLWAFKESKLCVLKLVAPKNDFNKNGNTKNSGCISKVVVPRIFPIEDNLKLIINQTVQNWRFTKTMFQGTTSFWITNSLPWRFCSMMSGDKFTHVLDG